MKAIFVGRTRPYPRKPERGGGIAYGVVVAIADPQEAGCIQEPIRCASTALLDARFSQMQSGIEVDLDIQPRMFQGKPSGFDVVGING